MMPPDLRSKLSSTDDEQEVLVTGRLPDCTMTLVHLSSSRCYLRLHSKSSSNKPYFLSSLSYLSFGEPPFLLFSKFIIYISLTDEFGCGLCTTVSGV